MGTSVGALIASFVWAGVTKGIPGLLMKAGEVGMGQATEKLFDGLSRWLPANKDKLEQIRIKVVQKKLGHLFTDDPSRREMERELSACMEGVNLSVDEICQYYENLDGLKERVNQQVQAVQASDGVKQAVADILYEVLEAYIKDKGTEDSFHRELTIIDHNMHRDTNQVAHENSQKLDAVREGMNQLLGQNAPATPAGEDLTGYSCTQDFVDMWNDYAFLHKPETGNALRLRDIYQPPSCYVNGDESARLSLEEAEQKLANKRGNGMVVVLGEPGIGKSTLIARYVATYTGKKQVLVYPCRSLGLADWMTDDLYGSIIEKVRLIEKVHLMEKGLQDCILILDGLDEIADRGSLDTILTKLRKSYEDCTADCWRFARLVVTCREGYLTEKKLRIPYIRLLPFADKEIDKFCKNFGEKREITVPEEKRAALKEGKAVYGIPLILYMVLALALDVEITEQASVVDVYDQIFDPVAGGIYRRSVGGRSYDNGEETEEPEEEEQEQWRKLHALSQDMAVWMHQYENEKAEIPKSIFDGLATAHGLSPEQALDYFKKLQYSEAGHETVHFIHRTMFEYFVADAIARRICPRGDAPLPEGDALADSIRQVCDRLRNGDIRTGECVRYLSKMLDEGFAQRRADRQAAYRQWELAFFRQLERGVPDWTYRREKSLFWPAPVQGADSLTYWQRLRQEKRCFANGMLVLWCIRAACGVTDLIGAYTRKEMGDLCHARVLPTYLCINLATDGNGIVRYFLECCDLRGAYLRGADFCDADLRGADLRYADLRYADFCGADLRGANLDMATISRRAIDRDLLRELQKAWFKYIYVWKERQATRYSREDFFAAFPCE